MYQKDDPLSIDHMEATVEMVDASFRDFMF